jgi:hypothetical protein
VDGRAETFDGYILGKTFSDSLERSEIDLCARGLLASSDPADAKLTLPIIDENRFFGWRNAVNQAVRGTSMFHLLILSVAHSSRDSLWMERRSILRGKNLLKETSA